MCSLYNIIHIISDLDKLRFTEFLKKYKIDEKKLWFKETLLHEITADAQLCPQSFGRLPYD